VTITRRSGIAEVLASVAKALSQAGVHAVLAASQQVKIPIAPRTGGRIVSMSRQTRND
jgi:hypothetical protein